MFGRIVILVFGLFGAVGLGQAPEMTSQYQQRMGGAINELRTVIDQFDADVAKNGLTRETALETYQASQSPFLQDRGRSMQQALARFDTLLSQVATFQITHDIVQPVYLFTQADEKIMQGMLEDYSFGLPVTYTGVLYALLGLFIGCLFGWILKQLARLDVRRGEPRMSG